MDAGHDAFWSILPRQYRRIHPLNTMSSRSSKVGLDARVDVMNQKRFRMLLVLYATLVVASSLAAFLPVGYSQTLNDALDNEPVAPLLENTWLAFGVAVPFALATIAGIYGLYSFKRWGRSLSLYSTLAGLVVFPLFGPSLQSGLESALFEASTLLWGAILAVSYYSNISTSFIAHDAPLPASSTVGG